LFMLKDGKRVTLKVPSTPRNPEQGALAALRALEMDLGEVGTLVHGSTVATNAVLERKGVPTGMITTDGFRDLLELQRQDKETIWDLAYRKPEALISRDMVREVKERVGPNSEVVVPLNAPDVKRAVQELVEEKGISSLAICFLHSYANPRHELMAAEIIRGMYPGLFLALSSDVLPEFREYERASTTALSAYVMPIMERYVGSMQKGLKPMGFKGKLHLMQSNGGILPARAASRHAIRFLFSGPAAGVTGATYLAQAAGLKDIITFDMGGTSTDVCLVTGGMPQITTEGGIDRLPIKVPVIDIVSVGAGGGSIARVDGGGMLRVGPQSAGAEPGPACYGRGGTESTVTDANVLLGYIRPHRFLGGHMKLDRCASERAFGGLASALGLSLEDAAEAVVKVANVNMIQAIRIVSTERGHDPRDYWLVAYGGAGPLHAVTLADELHLKGVLIPPSPSVLSAFGLLAADFRRDYTRTAIAMLKDDPPINTIFRSLREQAEMEFGGYGAPVEELAFTYSLDVRYSGQAFELQVPVEQSDLLSRPAEAIQERFQEQHARRYGHAGDPRQIELVNYRLLAVWPQELPGVQELGSSLSTPEPEMGEVMIGGRLLSCPFYQRAELGRGARVLGPSVIEEDTSSTVVPPGWSALIDGIGNIRLSPQD
ncbi:MAG: hydantoinase/oxoprolinase family protein, partial [Chloroflexi bacterium]|nr:hydantoinase/oxoprolinase family protein [Chloroflexota bacterium]